MEAMPYRTARAQLAETLQRVCEDHAPLIITRHGRASVVIVSLEDHQALEDTARLLRSPAHAHRRLVVAAQQPCEGQGTPHGLSEPKP